MILRSSETIHIGTDLEKVPVEGGHFIFKKRSGRSDRSIPVYVHSFYMSKYPVTVHWWNSIVDETMKKAVRNTFLPVTRVNFYEALNFCNTLSMLSGLNPCYSGIQTKRVIWNRRANGYRLPTVQEWMYAAAGGNRTRGYIYSGSNIPFEAGWYYENAKGISQTVGKLKPNELGLYDMSGNVEEWCWDYREDEKEDLYKEKRIFRDRAICGGCFEGSAESMLLNDYHLFYALYRYNNTGFRVVCS